MKPLFVSMLTGTLFVAGFFVGRWSSPISAKEFLEKQSIRTNMYERYHMINNGLPLILDSLSVEAYYKAIKHLEVKENIVQELLKELK